MKIAIWNGKKLVAELDVREAPGPDLQLDPWNDKLHVVGPRIRGQVVTYLNGLTPRVNAPEPPRPRRHPDGTCIGCDSPPGVDHDGTCTEVKP